MNKIKLNLTKLWVILVIGIAGCFTAYSAPISLVAEGDSAYSHQHYDKAVECYRQALSKEGISAGLYSNLGSAAYHTGDYATAILSLERARRLDPSDKKIKSNLNFLTTRVTDTNRAELKGKKGNVEPDAPGFWGRLQETISIDHSSNSWAVLGVMSFLLCIGTIALYLFSPKVGLKKLGFFSSFVLLGFSIVFVIFSFMAANRYDSRDRAVIMDYKVALLSKPDKESAPATIPFTKGTVVKILEIKSIPGAGDWYEVRFNSTNSGWLPAEAVEII